MQSNLTIFANFFIDNEERFVRMKDSLQAMKTIEIDRYVVNVRGLFAQQTIEHLKLNVNSLHVFSIESSAGWFYDTSKISHLIKTPYVLPWIEDHICMAPEHVNSIVDDMAKTDSDLMTYTFWFNGKFLQRYSGIEQSDAGSIKWFDHTLANDHNIQNGEYGKSYLISYASIIKTALFSKIISNNGRERWWSIMTPFNFEKAPEDTHWLPLRRANPKIELFASIDDDHGEIGSCLQARGLYPKRCDRQTYTESKDVLLDKVAKKLRTPLSKYKAMLLNFLSAPSQYRFDYLASHYAPLKLANVPLPLMNYSAIDYLISKMPVISSVFEYGSGQSTIFWANHGKQVISIEHDPEFYRSMIGKLSLIDTVDYRLIEPELVETGFDNFPSSDALCHSANFKGYTFKKYVESINVYPNDHFDVVVVDGRARPSCLARSVSKIKPGGLLVLDNSNRKYYLQETSALLVAWNKKTFFGPVRGLLHREQTTVYTKPLVN